ncbi:MAG: alpha-N-arabinofuranosidase [Terracidiphilus sp.]|jgi:alpha-N-arabinofuranosidase
MQSAIRTSALKMPALMLAVLFLPAVTVAQKPPVNVAIDASKTGAPISKYIYGQFLEHGGDIVNAGVWSEMLVDRKFFYPVASSAPTPPPVMGNAAGNPRFRRVPTRWWAPIGGDGVVTMDTKAPFTGEQTPLVKLDTIAPHGFSQSGIAVRKGKAYVGRILLSGSGGATVKVTLIWGKDAADRQSVTTGTLGAAYRSFPLRYTAAADTDDATLEITGTGAGSFHVGTVSLMPADNIDGFRAEVIAALKQLHFGVLRFPGGNFVSAYEWRYGVGEIDKRPPIFDPVWHALQPNDVGTDEFLTLCRLLGVDPYITVNAGFGDAWSARDLVEYTNGAATTPMGKWRAANGHPQPYGVKLWGVGNEPWGDYQMGSMSLPQFELKHNLFAKEMRKVDPSIKLIMGGAMPDVMEGADQARRINGQYVPDYLSPADWTGQMLLNCLDNIDMVSEHYYASGTQHTDMKQQKKVPIDPPLSFIEWQRAPAVQVRAKYEHYQEYLKRIPALRAKPVPIAIDEWAYFGGGPNSYKTVPAYAWAFHEMFRHSDIFQIGAFTFATAMMSSNRIEAILNPTGMLFKMYRDHFGVIPVEVTGDSPQPKPVFPAGGDQPAVNPGSDTYPLDVSAALSEDRKTLTFAVLNPSDTKQSMKLAVNGVKLAGQGTLWQMAPSSVDAVVAVGKKPEVAVEQHALGPVPDTIEAPPFSVSVYSYPLQ